MSLLVKGNDFVAILQQGADKRFELQCSARPAMHQQDDRAFAPLKHFDSVVVKFQNETMSLMLQRALRFR